MTRASWKIVLPLFLLASLVPAEAGARSAPASNGAFQFRLGGYFPEGSGEFWDGNQAEFFQDESDFNEVSSGSRTSLP